MTDIAETLGRIFSQNPGLLHFSQAVIDDAALWSDFQTTLSNELAAMRGAMSKKVEFNLTVIVETNGHRLSDKGGHFEESGYL